MYDGGVEIFWGALAVLLPLNLAFVVGANRDSPANGLLVFVAFLGLMGLGLLLAIALAAL